ELVQYANPLRLHRGGTCLLRDQSHPTDRRVRPEATYPDRGAARVHHDPDSAVDDEVHGVGRIPLAYDNCVRLDLHPRTMLDQLVSILGTTERFSKPLAQGAGLAAMRLVRLDNRILTRFKGSVEIGRHNDVVGNKSGGTEGVFHLARETREYHVCAALVSDLLDLCEAKYRG